MVKCYGVPGFNSGGLAGCCISAQGIVHEQSSPTQIVAWQGDESSSAVSLESTVEPGQRPHVDGIGAAAKISRGSATVLPLGAEGNIMSHARMQQNERQCVARTHR